MRRILSTDVVGNIFYVSVWRRNVLPKWNIKLQDLWPHFLNNCSEKCKLQSLHCAIYHHIDTQCGDLAWWVRLMKSIQEEAFHLDVIIAVCMFELHLASCHSKSNNNITCSSNNSQMKLIISSSALFTPPASAQRQAGCQNQSSQSHIDRAEDSDMSSDRPGFVGLGLCDPTVNLLRPLYLGNTTFGSF